jgi:hypothetical protein
MTAVYRLFGDDPTWPLYVGCTDRPDERPYEHRSKPWWSLVRAIAVEHYDTRLEALRAERRAIRAEVPWFNPERQPSKWPRPTYAERVGRNYLMEQSLEALFARYRRFKWIFTHAYDDAIEDGMERQRRLIASLL